MSKQRVIELQRQVRIAKVALTKVAARANRVDLVMLAENALDEMFKNDPKQPLQGLVGHDRNSDEGRGWR